MLAMLKQGALLMVCAAGLDAAAQVVNGGFEGWGAGQVPTGWSANNVAPLSFYPITSSTDAHSGLMAARGEVLQPLTRFTLLPPCRLHSPPRWRSVSKPKSPASSSGNARS
ncbi:MAG: hypothetical protein ACK4L7_12370, partial [Flavobacteriales bacterium]